MKFEDKVVIVTGASTGIGRSIAVEFGKMGANVGLIARRIDKLEITKEMIEKAGGKAEIYCADLSDLFSVNKLIKDIKKKTDKIWVLVNVAGVWHGKDEVYADKNLTKFDQKTILETYMVGLTTPTLLVHGLAGKMPKGSAILNLSGTFIYGAKGQVPYYVSKRAIEDLTIALSEDLASQNINVNCISPSDTSTASLQKYFPEDAVGGNTPEQVAKLAVSICQKKTTGKFWKIKFGKIHTEGYHK